MTILEWVFTGMVVLVASFTQYVAGFGFGPIASPFLLFILEPKVVIAYSVGLGTLLFIPILWQSRHNIHIRQMAPIIIGCALGLPVGLLMISVVSNQVLKLIIASLVVVFALVLASGYSYKFKNEQAGGLLAGFIGGVALISAGLGLPVVLFLINLGWSKDVFRANMSLFFVFGGLASSVLFAVTGITTASVFINAITFIPLVVLGSFLGYKVLHHINQIIFRRIAIGVVLAGGLMAMAVALRTILFQG